MKFVLQTIIWLGATAAGIAGASTTPAYITAALGDSARPADQVKQDPWRKPAEVISFAGIMPGDKVADFMPGNGYFTRLFSRVVGSKGVVYAYLPTQQLATCEPAETLGTKILEQDKRYDNVKVLIAASDLFAIPELLDMVFTAQDYHDLHDKFMVPTDVEKFNEAIFRSLKPDGIFLVIDHVAAPNSGLRDTETLHRIDPDIIRQEVTKAGFVFESQSEVLRNPEDTHTLIVFDPAIRHKTDQVIFKFRKPRTQE